MEGGPLTAILSLFWQNLAGLDAHNYLETSPIAINYTPLPPEHYDSRYETANYQIFCHNHHKIGL